uniref:Uncharacterized protein n=2 Tax=Meloidogyne TaxID=189290 RepID=A0A6V7VBH6_MELEN|nr:unnamed protein product [Meloidogyne enterolobii]
MKYPLRNKSQQDFMIQAKINLIRHKKRWWKKRDEIGRKGMIGRLILRRIKNEDLPESIFGEKHEKKRSKLMLPEPQISDKELEV